MPTVQEIRRAKARAIAKKMGVAAFAAKLGKQEGQVRHWIGPTPIKNIGTKITKEIETAFGKDPGWLDSLEDFQSLAEDAGLEPEELLPGFKRRERTKSKEGPSTGVVVSLMDARASMGIGSPITEYETVVDNLRLSLDWCRRHLTVTNFSNLAALSAYGDSMRPTFEDGDILLVDKGVNELKIDAVYVLQFRDELYVKRVQRRPDGNVVVKSDNTLYDPFVIDPAQNHLTVLGRVVWAWNGKKL